MRRHDPRIVSVYLAGVPAMNKRAIDSANDLMIDLIAVAALQPWNISGTHRVLLPCRTVGGRVLGQNSRRHLSRYRVITFLIAVTLPVLSRRYWILVASSATLAPLCTCGVRAWPRSLPAY